MGLPWFWLTLALQIEGCGMTSTQAIGGSGSSSHPEANGLFNIGTGRARSWNDLAGATFEAMGKDVQIEYISMPEHLRDKYKEKTNDLTPEVLKNLEFLGVDYVIPIGGDE